METTLEKRKNGHGSLPLIARKRFDNKTELYHVVNFLNRSLKKKGIIFGVCLVPEGMELAIYDANLPEMKKIST